MGLAAAHPSRAVVLKMATDTVYLWLPPPIVLEMSGDGDCADLKSRFQLLA